MTTERKSYKTVKDYKVPDRVTRPTARTSFFKAIAGGLLDQASAKEHGTLSAVLEGEHPLLIHHLYHKPTY